MKQRKKNAFTLIELIATMVIMAIIALIVTPLVMSIIRKARISADKRSVDAYGRSIELAIAGYLMDTGSFPTIIEQLTIEYSGDEVVCTTTQLNSDSSVYLAGCTVGGRSVDGYTYGKEEIITYDYKVGDLVTYNGVNYRVLKDVKSTDTSATLIKVEPLSVSEVNQYGTGHVNGYPYISSSAGTAYDRNGYGGMAYYSSETCGFINNVWDGSGCKNDYKSSDVKYVVDAWKAAQAPLATEARLISKDEYEPMTTVETYETPTEPEVRYVPMYDWQYNNNYSYWTNTPYDDSLNLTWSVVSNGNLVPLRGSHDYDSGVVRPVITISKSYLN